MKRIVSGFLALLILLYSGAGFAITGSSSYEAFHKRMKEIQNPSNAFALVLPSDSYGQWQNKSGNKLNFRVQVKNSSSSKTVKAFELYYYTVDVYGDNIEGEGMYYYLTTKKKIKPGKTAYSSYVALPYRNEIEEVYCGIKRVVFEDGTTQSKDTVDYLCWTID